MVWASEYHRTSLTGLLVPAAGVWLSDVPRAAAGEGGGGPGQEGGADPRQAAARLQGQHPSQACTALAQGGSKNICKLQKIFMTIRFSRRRVTRGGPA